jgi:hypothetical protein
VALAVLVPGCVALTWWQAARALAGNTLSWVYTFEWPIFAGYGLYMWWKLVHDEPVTPSGPDGPDGTDGPDETSEPDEEGAAPGAGGDDDAMAEYNRYLAELNASGRQKRW